MIRGSPDDDKRLLIVIHHLVVDEVSWRIVWTELTDVYQQLKDAEIPSLLPEPNTYKDWALALQSYAQSPMLQQEVDYWLGVKSDESSIPVDFKQGPNTEESSDTVRVTLSADATHILLHEVPKAYHTHIEEILLAALVLAYRQWSGQSALLLHLEGHGREALPIEIDISRTIGWFTNLYPVLLNVPHDEDRKDNNEEKNKAIRN